MEKVLQIERLAWRVSTNEHRYRRILHAASTVPAQGIWAIRPRPSGGNSRNQELFLFVSRPKNRNVSAYARHGVSLSFGDFQQFTWQNVKQAQ